MQFTTIQQIHAHKFIGNHASDSEAFKAIEAFCILPSTSIKDAAEALRYMGDEGMGLGRDENLTDEELVNLFKDSLE